MKVGKLSGHDPLSGEAFKQDLAFHTAAQWHHTSLLRLCASCGIYLLIVLLFINLVVLFIYELKSIRQISGNYFNALLFQWVLHVTSVFRIVEHF